MWCILLWQMCKLNVNVLFRALGIMTFVYELLSLDFSSVSTCTVDYGHEDEGNPIASYMGNLVKMYRPRIPKRIFYTGVHPSTSGIRNHFNVSFNFFKRLNIVKYVTFTKDYWKFPDGMYLIATPLFAFMLSSPPKSELYSWAERRGSNLSRDLQISKIDHLLIYSPTHARGIDLGSNCSRLASWHER